METTENPIRHIDELMAKYQIVDGDFSDLSKFKFEGVYIIYEGNTKNVVYIGSAYARNIDERLNQYTKKSDTGNTLMHAICKKDNNVTKVKDITSEQKESAIKKINKLKIKAIPHKDLEYQLIRDARPMYNTAGYEIDYSEEWFITKETKMKKLNFCYTMYDVNGEISKKSI